MPCRICNGTLQTAALAFYQHHAPAAFMRIIEFFFLSIFLSVRVNKSKELTQRQARQYVTLTLMEDFFFSPLLKYGGETKKALDMPPAL